MAELCLIDVGNHGLYGHWGNMRAKSKKLLFVVNKDQYFVTHRLHLAEMAINNGFEVGLLCNVSDYRDVIEATGVTLFDWKLSRGSVNPLYELRSIYGLFCVVHQFLPDIVHAVTLKSVIYSAVISKIKSFKSIYALGGLGFIYASNKLKARILRLIVSNALKILIGNKSRVILQNSDDKRVLINHNIINERQISLIRGAGVNIEKFTSSQRVKNNIPMVILPARMLWDKGINAFVECAKKINKINKKARFVLIGGIDLDNPESVPKKQLESWHNSGLVEWLGQQKNMPDIYQEADIVCFPSYYGEGLPMSLLESASCELPIVAFDVPGCREIVIDDVNGFLIEFNYNNALYNAVEKLLNDKSLRKRFGRAGRALVVEQFSQNRIGRETLSVWQEALS